MLYKIILSAIWVIYVFLNVGIADENNDVRLKRIASGNPKQIEHFWYALGYTAACSVWFLIFKEWFFFSSLLIIHLGIFPTAYNIFSKLPIFNLSHTSTAISDRIMVKIGLKNTAIVNIAATALSIIFLIISFDR